jgi:hypothetical protein
MFVPGAGTGWQIGSSIRRQWTSNDIKRAINILIAADVS